MKKALRLLLGLALALSLAVPALADMGPRPSVIVRMENLQDTQVYGTILSGEADVAPSPWYSNMLGEQEMPAEVAAAMAGYEAEEVYFTGAVWDCSAGAMSWSQNPPDSFRVLLYMPGNGQFLLSDELEHYAFDSYYTASLAGGTLALSRSYDYAGELGSLALRCVLTIALELLIAPVFGFKTRRELGFMAVVNVATQLALNLAANMVHYFSGGFTAAFILLEALVTLAEALIYRRCLPRRGQNPPREGAVYAVFANLLSAIAGLLLACALPGMF